MSDTPRVRRFPKEYVTNPKAVRQLRYRRQRREQGRCGPCGKPAMPGKATCAPCVAAEKRRYQARRQRVFDHYGRSCACCGETTFGFLTLDHINKDGAELPRSVKNHIAIYFWLIQQGFPEGFQTLCYNCNYGKAKNGGVCPHLTAETDT